SPKREYEADRFAAELCGSPHGLADALLRLEQSMGLVAFEASPATEPLYTTNPFAEEGLAALFITHPPLGERVRRVAPPPRRLAPPEQRRQAGGRDELRDSGAGRGRCEGNPGALDRDVEEGRCGRPTIACRPFVRSTVSACRPARRTAIPYWMSSRFAARGIGIVRSRVAEARSKTSSLPGRRTTSLPLSTAIASTGPGWMLAKRRPWAVRLVDGSLGES